MAEKTRAVIIAEYSAVKLFQWLVLLMSWPFAHSFGRVLGSLCSYLMYKRTRIVKENLKNAFPSKSKAEVEDIMRKVWQNLGQTAVEVMKMTRISKKDFDKYVTVRGFEYIDKALAKKRGVILLTAHYFNWEMMGISVSMKGYPLAIVARLIKNYLVDRFIINNRQSFGAKIIYHRNAIKEGMRFLKRNGIFGLLIDQHYGSGVEVDYFSRKALTSPIISTLAGRLGSPVLPIRNWREGDRLIIEVSPEVKLPEFKTIEQYNKEGTQLLTGIIEGWVREKPEGWFWVHRRWR